MMTAKGRWEACDGAVSHDREQTPPVWCFPVEHGRFYLIADWDLGPLVAYLDSGATEISLPERSTLLWLSSIEWYLAHHARGVPCLAVRYEDLALRQEETPRAILTACGLPATIGPDMLDIFARDAQAGTILAREAPDQGNQVRLTDAEMAAMQRILARHPVVQTPSFVVPGTLLA